MPSLYRPSTDCLMLSNTDTSEVLEDLRNLLKTSLSESNYQQQDLDAIKDDLSLLKLGFALLQESSSRISVDSIKQLFILKKLKGTIEAKGTTLEAVLTAVSVLPDLESQTESIAMTLESVEMSTEECVESIQETHHPCGGSGWKKIADVDMAKLSHSCPAGWTETGYSKRTCGRTSTVARSCDPTTFEVPADLLPSYTRVCGRILAYVWGGPDAFNGFRLDSGSTTISENFADGLLSTMETPSPTHLDLCSWCVRIT